MLEHDTFTFFLIFLLLSFKGAEMALNIGLAVLFLFHNTFFVDTVYWFLGQVTSQLYVILWTWCGIHFLRGFYSLRVPSPLISPP